MTFEGGAYILLDSEIGHNFDDITDISTPVTYAFHSLSANSFLACETGDNFIQEVHPLQIIPRNICTESSYPWSQMHQCCFKQPI